jgi:hypothetical protein
MSVYGVGHVLESEGSNSLGGVLFVGEVAYMMHDAVECGPSTPAACRTTVSRLLPGNASILRRGESFLFGSVLGVLGWGDFPEIAGPIVQVLPIDVVDDDGVTIFGAHDFSMQIDDHARLDASGSFIATKMPAVLIDPERISGVDQGVRSNGAVTSIQGDEGDILKAHQSSLLVSVPASFARWQGHSLLV